MATNARGHLTRGAPAAEIELPIEAKGPVDSTFGDAGVVVFGNGVPNRVAMPLVVNGEPRNSNGLVVVDDRRIVTASTTGASPEIGRAFVARFSEDGRVDTTFGAAGRITLGIETRGYNITDVHPSLERYTCRDSWSWNAALPTGIHRSWDQPPHWFS